MKKLTKIVLSVLCACVLCAGVVGLAGCSKKQEAKYELTYTGYRYDSTTIVPYVLFEFTFTNNTSKTAYIGSDNFDVKSFREVSGAVPGYYSMAFKMYDNSDILHSENVMSIEVKKGETIKIYLKADAKSSYEIECNYQGLKGGNFVKIIGITELN